jgi:predicted membrane GTPase involved in stress response
MDYPVLYASAKQGWAVTDLAAMPAQDTAEVSSHDGMKPLFDMILEHCPAPRLARTDDDPFSMITIQIESGAFLLRLIWAHIPTNDRSVRWDPLPWTCTLRCASPWRRARRN